MKYGMVFPRKYFQGDGILKEIGSYTKILGNRPLVVWGKRTREAAAEAVIASFAGEQMTFFEWDFAGESSKEEAEKVMNYAKEVQADAIIGLGGGKAIDTAKGVAGWMKLPVMIVPTIAATDAPLTSTSGWYEDGVMTEIYAAPFNPDILLVDTGIIARAPLRTFRAGMGDGITTYIESAAAFASRSTKTNRAKALPTLTSRAICKLCFDILMEDGLEAIRLVEKGLVTPVVERVVEALVLMSGIGGESGGIAVAHSIANNLPYFPENRAYFHGEDVAFGVVTQLMIDDTAEVAETEKIVDWMIAAGLPVTFEEIGLGNVTKEEIKKFAEYCIESPVSFFEGMVIPIEAESLYQALLAADDYGHLRKEAAQKETVN